MRLLNNRLYMGWMWLIVWLVILPNSGCIQHTSVSAKPAEPDERSAFEYYHWASTAPEVVIRREIKYLNEEPALLDLVVSKTRLAMLLTLSTDVPAGNEKRAMELLDQVIEQTSASNNPVHKDYRQFSLLWQDMVSQRKELRQSLNKTNMNLIKEKEKVKTLQNENTELVKQIEALKSIEQQITNREQKRDNR